MSLTREELIRLARDDVFAAASGLQYYDGRAGAMPFDDIDAALDSLLCAVESLRRAQKMPLLGAYVLEKKHSDE